MILCMVRFKNVHLDSLQSVAKPWRNIYVAFQFFMLPESGDSERSLSCKQLSHQKWKRNMNVAPRFVTPIKSMLVRLFYSNGNMFMIWLTLTSNILRVRAIMIKGKFRGIRFEALV